MSVQFYIELKQTSLIWIDIQSIVTLYYHYYKLTLFCHLFPSCISIKGRIYYTNAAAFDNDDLGDYEDDDDDACDHSCHSESGGQGKQFHTGWQEDSYLILSCIKLPQKKLLVGDKQ